MHIAFTYGEYVCFVFEICIVLAMQFWKLITTDIAENAKITKTPYPVV